MVVTVQGSGRGGILGGAVSVWVSVGDGPFKSSGGQVSGQEGGRELSQPLSLPEGCSGTYFLRKTVQTLCRLGPEGLTYWDDNRTCGGTAPPSGGESRQRR